MTINNHIAAGIDLGSNTFRLLAADCAADSLKVLAKKTATVRLGRGLAHGGLLHEESMQNGFSVLRSFRQVMDRHQPESIRICGTEALRQAKNSRLFLDRAEEILQHTIDIINGEEEARLSLAGVLAGCREPVSGPLLLVDVGGGSTELVFAESPSGKTRMISVPIGVVGLTENFISTPPIDPAPLDRLLKETLTKHLNGLKLLKKKNQIRVLGCGGTATSMAALDLNLTSYNESLVHGHVLNKRAIEKLWEKLIVLPADKRNALPCLGDARGEILPAGIRLYHVLLTILQEDRLSVSDTGLLEGILLSSLPNTAA